MITLNPHDLKTDVNELTSESIEVKLIQFAKSKYDQELAEKNACDKFIQYCLDNIYHITIDDILKSTTKIIDGKWKVDSDYLIYMEAAVAAGLIIAAEIGVIAISIGTEDKKVEAESSDMASAAIICGGKEFGEKVVNRYCEMLQEKAKSRGGQNNG